MHCAFNTLESRISILLQPEGLNSIAIDKITHKVDGSGKDGTTV